MTKEIIDKINIKQKIKNGEEIILEFGSGLKNNENKINIDIQNLPTTNIVANLEYGLSFLPNNSVDEIHTTSFLEHIENFELLMTEIHRVLKPNKKIKIFVPHFSNPYFYSDYTHKRFFGLYSFSYFSKSHHPFHRKVPKFYNTCNFRITNIKLIFHSRLLTKIINSRLRLMELYEYHLSFIIPCYGIDVELTALKNE